MRGENQLRSGYYPEGNYVLVLNNRGRTKLVKRTDVVQFKQK